jgi:hypothetical protein
METIAKAFLKAQKEFSPALKTATNPHFKSKYVSLDGCIESVIDALNNNGISLIQKNHDCDNGVKVETVFFHESGELLSGGVLHVPAQKNDPQAYGSALTYARRYSLMSACGIAPEDDDGNAASQPQKPAPAYNIEDAKKQLGVCKTLDELKRVFAAQWNACPKDQQPALSAYKDEIKSLIESVKEAA